MVGLGPHSSDGSEMSVGAVESTVSTAVLAPDPVGGRVNDRKVATVVECSGGDASNIEVTQEGGHGRNRSRSRDRPSLATNTQAGFPLTPSHFADVNGEFLLSHTERELLRRALRDASFEFHGKRLIPFLSLVDEDLLAAGETAGRSASGSTSFKGGSDRPALGGFSLRKRRKDGDVDDAADLIGLPLRKGRPVKQKPPSKVKPPVKAVARQPVLAPPQEPVLASGAIGRRSSRQHKAPGRLQQRRVDDDDEYGEPEERDSNAGAAPRRLGKKEHKKTQERHPIERAAAAKRPRNRVVEESDEISEEELTAREERRREKRSRHPTGEARRGGAKGRAKSDRGVRGPAAAVSKPVPPRVHQLLTPQEKGDLQRQIDRLNEDQLDRVLDFLAPDLGDGSDGQEVQLDLDTLLPDRQHALVAFVDAELRNAQADTEKDAVKQVMSPAFPVMEPGATPLATDATPRRDAVGAEATPRRDPGANLAKRQLAWEACSVREVQRQSHLREVREAASVGGTPHSTPGGAEPMPHDSLPVVPELTLPPAATAGIIAGAPAIAAVSHVAAPPPAVEVPAPAVEACQQPAAIASLPVETTAALVGDSMLESTAEVLNMVDFGWM